MPQRAMAKQMLDANKAAFDSSFQAMVMLQEQAEKMTLTLLEQTTWLPDEGKKMIREWIDGCKKGRDDYKKRVDEGYAKVAEFLREKT
ncbi:MAG: hypothetical protein Kow0092_19810 [Deferrisomatales bacterium]